MEHEHAVSLALHDPRRDTTASLRVDSPRHEKPRGQASSYDVLITSRQAGAPNPEREIRDTPGEVGETFDLNTVTDSKESNTERVNF
jgi:hypothetical protein